MAEATDSYSLHPRSTVKRYKKRGKYDYETIHTIVNSSLVVHVSFHSADPVNDPFPAILPMIGVMGSFVSPNASLSSPLKCYLHGYVSSRLMRSAKTTIDDTQASDSNATETGLPVSIAATHVDGIVLALTPNHHSYNYRSAVLHGYAAPVTDTAEKLWAMELLTNSIVPSRWEHTRIPPTNAEMVSTQILRVDVVSASAKVRSGGPKDDRADVKNQAVVENVWTGVVPVVERLGEPFQLGDGEVKSCPGYLEEWVRGSNARREDMGKAALQEAD